MANPKNKGKGKCVIFVDSRDEEFKKSASSDIIIYVVCADKDRIDDVIRDKTTNGFAGLPQNLSPELMLVNREKILIRVSGVAKLKAGFPEENCSLYYLPGSDDHLKFPIRTDSNRGSLILELKNAKDRSCLHTFCFCIRDVVERGIHITDEVEVVCDTQMKREFKEDLIWFHYQTFFKSLSDKKIGELSSMMRRRNSYEELFHENKPVYTYLTYRTSRGEVVFRHNTTKHWLRAQTCMLQTPGDTSVLRNPEENKDEELASWDYYFYLRLINEGEAKKSHEDLIMDHIVSKISPKCRYTARFIRTILRQERCLLLFDLPSSVPVSKDNHHVVKTDDVYEQGRTKIFILCPWKLYKRHIEDWDVIYHTDISVYEGPVEDPLDPEPIIASSVAPGFDECRRQIKTLYQKNHALCEQLYIALEESTYDTDRLCISVLSWDKQSDAVLKDAVAGILENSDKHKRAENSSEDKSIQNAMAVFVAHHRDMKKAIQYLDCSGQLNVVLMTLKDECLCTKWYQRSIGIVCAGNIADFKTNLDMTLERHVLHGIQDNLKVLQHISKNDLHIESTRDEPTCISGMTDYLPFLYERCHFLKPVDDGHTSGNDSLVMDTCEIQQSLKRHFEAVKQHLPEIQDLIAEMLGLYYRSSLSDDEIPDSGSPTILSDQLKLQLFGTGYVVGLGYRYGSLMVDLDGNKLQSVKERSQEEERVRNIVQSCAISHCVIQFVSKNITLFQTPASGSKIGASNTCGTLGAFSQSKNNLGQSSLHALISNHVAKRLSGDGRIFFIDEAGNKKFLGKTVVSEGLLDVATVDVDKGLANQCDTRLRTLTNEPTVCKLLNFTHKRSVGGLMGRHVYIHGAVTTTGQGKIAIPEYFVDDFPFSLVLVEDLDEVEPHSEGRHSACFSMEGDSGAAVCAKNVIQTHVDAISILQGERFVPQESNANAKGDIKDDSTTSENKSEAGEYKTSDKEKDPSQKSGTGESRKRKQYMTIPLQSCLSQIRQERGFESLQLCDEVNNPGTVSDP